MIDVSDVVNDSDFSESFYVLRSTGGQWVAGGFQDTRTQLTMYGSIQVGTEEDTNLTVEGDRITGSITVHITVPLYISNTKDYGEQSFGSGGFGSKNPANSDIVVWHNQQWVVNKQLPWSDFGYFKYYCVRTSTE